MGAVRLRGRIIMASVACKTSITHVERRAWMLSDVHCVWIGWTSCTVSN